MSDLPVPDDGRAVPLVGTWRPPAELVRAVGVGGLIATWVLAISTAEYAFRGYVFRDVMPVGVDAHAYWLAGTSAHPYDQPPGYLDAFLYSPLFQQLMHPFALLPFPVFFALWMVVEAAIFIWLLAPLPKRWAIPLLIFCVPELLVGNVVGFLALAAVLGVRRPEAWSVPLLTKITPGMLGLAWHVSRGEWRQCARAVVFTLLLVAVSAAVSPGLWVEWFDFLRGSGNGHGGVEALLRAALALALVVAGARNGRAWVLGPAFLVCTPVLGGVNVLAMLAAVPRLARLDLPPVRPWWLPRTRGSLRDRASQPS